MRTEQDVTDQPPEESAPEPDVVEFQIGRKRLRTRHFPGETVLETARRAGVALAAGCEQGNCGTCIVSVLRGAVRMRNNAVLSEEEVQSGLALACQSVPDGADLLVEVY